jgi:hydrogenase expression/formation protein HypD
MKYIDEYRDMALIKKLAGLIRKEAVKDYTFMEVCGGHTAAIHRFGIPSLLPPNIRLVSGPGCPVCVTGREFIDKAIAYSKMDDVIIATFGDLLRVPGSQSSLEKEKAAGADIRIVFSGLDALGIAGKSESKRVIFLGIGFETTAPGTAATVEEAKKSATRNFLVLSAHKVMPPAMDAIIRDGTDLNGFICPGHVAAVTGSSIFSFIPEKYSIGCVVTGFEPVDLLQSVYMLVRQVNMHSPQNQIQYTRAVSVNGNIIARGLMEKVFDEVDDHWRGFGIISKSGLKLRNQYEEFDVEKAIPVIVKSEEDNKLCMCGEILRGRMNPSECSLFGVTCLPGNPVGACMVSAEGTCNTFFKYRLNG